MAHCNYKVKFEDHKRILKTARKGEKKATCYIVTYNGIPIRLISRIFSKTFQGQKRVAWYIQDAERRKKKNFQPKILSPTKLSLKIKGDINSFTDKQKKNEFINIKTVIQKMLK